MKKTKKILANLAPFLLYWSTAFIYLFLGFFEVIDLRTGAALATALYAAGALVLGWFVRLKTIRWGLGLFAAQIVLGTVLWYAAVLTDWFGTAADALGTVFALCNLFNTAYTPFDTSAQAWANVLFALLVPLAFTPAGFGLRTACRHLPKRRAKQNG